MVAGSQGRAESIADIDAGNVRSSVRAAQVPISDQIVVEFSREGVHRDG